MADDSRAPFPRRAVLKLAQALKSPSAAIEEAVANPAADGGKFKLRNPRCLSIAEDSA